MATMDPDERIPKTGFTVGWLRDRLLQWAHKKELLPRDCSPAIASWHSEQIGEGQGFLSVLVRVALQWDASSPHSASLPAAAVVKTPTYETLAAHVEKMDFGAEKYKEFEEQMENDFLPLAHKNECLAYALLEDTPVPVGAMYHGDADYKSGKAVLLMEDYVSAPCTTVNIADGLNRTQVEQIIDSIAALHAWSLGKGKSMWHKDTFDIMGKEQLKTWPEMMEMTLDKLSEKRPEYFSKDLVQKMAWFHDIDFIYSVIMTDSAKYTKCPFVIVHGDMWTNNMLFNKGEDGEPGNLLALIDWQVAHAGCMAEDIGRVLVSSCSARLRREITDDVLAYYHRRLAEHMGAECPFTLEQVKWCYDLTLPFSTMFYMFGVPIMTESAVVDGPDRERRVDEMYYRCKCAIDDSFGVRHVYDQVKKVLDKERL